MLFPCQLLRPISTPGVATVSTAAFKHKNLSCVIKLQMISEGQTTSKAVIQPLDEQTKGKNM